MIVLSVSLLLLPSNHAEPSPHLPSPVTISREALGGQLGRTGGLDPDASCSIELEANLQRREATNGAIGQVAYSVDLSWNAHYSLLSSANVVIERRVGAGAWHHLCAGTGQGESVDEGITTGVNYHYRAVLVVSIDGRSERFHSNIQRIFAPSAWDSTGRSRRVFMAKHGFDPFTGNGDQVFTSRTTAISSLTKTRMADGSLEPSLRTLKYKEFLIFHPGFNQFIYDTQVMEDSPPGGGIPGVPYGASEERTRLVRMLSLSSETTEFTKTETIANAYTDGLLVDNARMVLAHSNWSGSSQSSYILLNDWGLDANHTVELQEAEVTFRRQTSGGNAKLVAVEWDVSGSCRVVGSTDGSGFISLGLPDKVGCSRAAVLFSEEAYALDVRDYRNFCFDRSERQRAAFNDHRRAGESLELSDPSGATIWLDQPDSSVTVRAPSVGHGADRCALSWSGDAVEVLYGGVPVEKNIIGRFDGEVTVRAKRGATPGSKAKFSLHIEASGVAMTDFCYVHLAKRSAFKRGWRVNDMAGPRFRKIALNGRPLPDERPEAVAESDAAKEETYIDAFNLNLRHSTTDVYLPIPGSELAISVTRNYSPDCWNLHSGLRPHERPDLAFGACWSTNVVAGYRVSGSTDATPSEPDYCFVSDENGGMYTFARTGGRFLPIVSGRHEAKEFLNTFTGSRLSKKFGTTVDYMQRSVGVRYASDRFFGRGGAAPVESFGSVQCVRDRLGYEIRYEYAKQANSGSDGPLGPSLVPTRIYALAPDEDGDGHGEPIPNLQIFIKQDENHRITSIWDPLGNETTYEYAQVGGFPHPATGVPQWETVLTGVRRADGGTVRYDYYGPVSEADTLPATSSQPSVTKYHIDLRSITNPVGAKHEFLYKFDQSKLVYVKDGAVSGYYAQTGLPRQVQLVTLPDGSRASFRAQSLFRYDPESATTSFSAASRATDAQGNSTSYSFQDPEVAVLEDFKTLYQGGAAFNNPILITYRSMQIDHAGIGSETYTFAPGAGMALSQIQDFSGNVTTYQYADPWKPSDPDMAKICKKLGVNSYDDPTSITRSRLTKTMRYDPDSRQLTRVRDERGVTTTYELDDFDRRIVERVSGPGMMDQVTTFDYDPLFRGVVTRTETQGGARGPDSVTEHTLYGLHSGFPAGRIAETAVGVGASRAVTHFTYDWNGMTRSSEDPNGHLTVFDYDSRNRLIRVINHDDTFRRIDYDAASRKIAEFDEKGVETRFLYDHAGRLESQTVDPGGIGARTRFEYNRVGSLTMTVDPRGVATVTTYDRLQRPTSVSTAGVSVSYGYGRNSGSSAFDTSGFKPTRITDERGFVTENTYDDRYRLVASATTYADGKTAVTHTTYDQVGNPTSVKDPNGKITRTAYDALNRPTVVTRHDGATTRSFYTGTGLVWKTVDVLGRETFTEYDSQGRPVKVTGPAVNGVHPISWTEYDDAGNLTKTIDARHRETVFQYDSRNRRTHQILPAVPLDGGPGTVQPVIETAYDAVGNVTAVKDARGAITITDYDALRRPYLVTNALNGTIRTTYDANGNPLTVTDANDKATINQYDARNRLVQTIDPAGIRTVFAYDAKGNRTAITDGNKRTTTFDYDGLNRLTQTTWADGSTETLLYDDMNKVGRIDGNGNETRYEYDDLHRLTYVRYIGAPEQDRTYTYDAAGRIRAVMEPGKGGLTNVAYTYDDLDRITSETSAGITHTHTYDLVGNRLSTTFGTTGRTLVNEYDALNRLQTMTDAGRVIGYGYDRNGNTTRQFLPNGQFVVSGFDALNRLIHRTTLDGAGMPLQSFTNAHDDVGNVIRIEEAWLTSVAASASGAGSVSPLPQSKSPIANRIVNLGYDDAYRLTREEILPDGAPAEVSTYSYDDASNRTGMVRSGPKAATTVSLYNSLNQLTAFTETPWDGPVRQVSYTYDGAGSRITRTEAGKEQSPDLYSYDREHRLTGLSQTREATVQITVSPQQTGGVTLSPAAAAARAEATFSRRRDYAYAYDYRTRRVGRIEGGAASTVVFLGGLSVQEYGREANGARKAQPEVEHIRGSGMAGGVGGLVYSVRGAGAGAQPSYNLYNSRGDVVAQTNGTGAFTWQAAYEAFGTRTGESGLNRERHRANTKDEDPTGLLNEGMRYRDLETGVWLTRDPAGFVDGPNLYAYVRQNPWTAFDPTGLNLKLINALKNAGKWRGIDGAIQPGKGPKGQAHVSGRPVILPDNPAARPNSTYVHVAPSGTKYPVAIDGDGFVDFRPHAHSLPNGEPGLVSIEMSGKDKLDFSRANAKAGISQAYLDEKQLTWHHDVDGHTMVLVPRELNTPRFGGMPHTGGGALVRAGQAKASELGWNMASFFAPNLTKAITNNEDAAQGAAMDVYENFTIPGAIQATVLRPGYDAIKNGLDKNVFLPPGERNRNKEYNGRNRVIQSDDLWSND